MPGFARCDVVVRLIVGAVCVFAEGSEEVELCSWVGPPGYEVGAKRLRRMRSRERNKRGRERTVKDHTIKAGTPLSHGDYYIIKIYVRCARR